MSDQMLENYNQNRNKKANSGDPESDWLYAITSTEAPESNVDIAWEKTTQKILDKSSIDQHNFSPLAVAASLVVLAVCAFIFKGYLADSVELQIVQSDGLKSIVTFPDGSIAELNINSEVKFLEEFGETRAVQFSGEAYFDIKKSEKPFIIKMGEVDVRVLGTAFNLITDNNEVRILVDRGLVAMESEGNEVRIAKGEMGIFKTETSEILVDTTPPSNILSWKNGKFSFREASLEEATKELAKFYNVTFDLSNTVKECKITANFDNVQLKEVLVVFETILGVSIEKDNSIVRIKGKGCQ